MPQKGPNMCGIFPFDFYQFCVLLCICSLTFGSYWVFDIPGAIQTQITDWFAAKNIVYTNNDNLVLYYVYSYPNIVLALFGGLLVDKMGVRTAAVAFCFLILVGQILFSIGISSRTYWLAVFGRFVFGLGGESLTVAQNTYTARWFEGKILAFAFGLVVSFSRIGSAINFAVSPVIATGNGGVTKSVWVGTGCCIGSFIAVIILYILDYKGQDRVKEVSADEKISLKHVSKFTLPLWIIYLICMFFYGAILTFYTVASVILQNTGYRYKDTIASLFLAIPNIISIFTSPLFGYLVDKIGRSALIVLIASIMLIFAHIGMLANALFLDPLNQINPALLMVWIGIAYALGAAALWPMVAFIIDTGLLGTAYGLMTSIQNAGLAIFPTIIGSIMDSKKISDQYHYLIPILLFILFAFISASFSFFLITLDKRYTGGKLMATGLERTEMVKREEEEKKLLGGFQDS